MKGILGRKVGMTEVFLTNGRQVPVTVVEIEPNVVTQIKTTDKEGYDAIQIGAFNKREKVSNKPEMGHIKKSNTSPKRFLKEIRGVDVTLYTLGQEVKADLFEVGETVDVTGTSKGKGFQGVIKRHNQSRGPMGHGSHYHRGPGSMGTMRPMRVMKGKKLPGHMGDEQVTIQNLTIVSVDVENNYILVSGNIRGPKGSLVLVKSSIKKGDVKKEIELVNYEEPEVVEEVTEEVVEVETPEETTAEVENTQEVVEETVEEVKEETTTPEETEVKE